MPTAGARAAPPPGTCQQCGGRGVLVTNRVRLPCPSCQPAQRWRQSPEYRPGQPLLSLSDLNLSALEVQQQQQQQRRRPADALAAGSGSSAVEQHSPRKRRRGRLPGVPHGPMPEERRQAISAGQRRKAATGMSDEHRRRIALAMRDYHARRQARMRCSHCGREGHNRRSCPALAGGAQASAGGAGSSSSSSSSRGASAAAARRPKLCSVCGQPGHNKRSCPQAAEARAAPGRAGPRKLIVVQEEREGALAGASAALTGPGAQPSGSLGSTSDGADKAASSSGTANSGSSSGSSSRDDGVSGSSVADGQVLPAPRPDPPPLAPAPTPVSLQMRDGPLSLFPDGSLMFALPLTPEQCVAQAAGAVLRAWEDGLRRQSLTLLLPSQGGGGGPGGGPGGGDGWPGGIRQQFRVALPMVEGLLRRLKGAEGLRGRITTEMLDEGDCVGEAGRGGVGRGGAAPRAAGPTLHVGGRPALPCPPPGRPAPPRPAPPHPHSRPRPASPS